MLLTDARRPARTAAGGRRRSPLADQDRGRWDHADRGGHRAARRRDRPGRVGEYQLQAAIAAIHDRATTRRRDRWPQILALYELLERMTGNPVVTLTAPSPPRWSTVRRPGWRSWRVSTSRSPASTSSERTSTSRRATVSGHSPTTAARPARATNVAERRYLDAQVARLADVK